MAALKIHSKHYKSYGDYSATTLINPPRIVALSNRYGHLVGVNPERDMASFIGTGVHNYFEQTLRQFAALNEEYELERGVFDKINGRLITGRFDILYKGKHIYDIKTAKCWKKIFDPDMVDWHSQQNIYAYLLGLRGVQIETINIIAVYLDWQKNNAVRDHSYPQERVQQYQLNLWSPERAEAFINERLALHIEAEDLADEDLPACTPEERWERFVGGGTVKYALLKDRSAERAMRVLNTVDEIREYAEQKNLPDSTVVEVRHAQRKRCEYWCDVAPWCNHYRQYLIDKNNDNLNDYTTIGEII